MGGHMKEQNEVLCSVIYDSIDLFADFKKKGYVYGKHITNDDKVAISLYLSLISNNPIINKIMNNFNYKYKINLEKNNLTVDEYYDYFIKYFYKFLKFNNFNAYTTYGEFMEMLLNTGVIEKLKKYFEKRNKYTKIITKKR
jgi:hypothetical protein